MTEVEGVPVNPLPANAERVFAGRIFEVWRWEQELFDGTFAPFERLKRPDYAYVVGVLPDERIMLVQDDQPDRDAVLTPAGGKVEEGEEPAQAAARELLEETGYEAAELVPWHAYRPSSKIEFVTHAFIGRGLRKVGEPALEAGERVELQFFTFEEFVQLGQNPRLRDWLLRIKLLEAQVDSEKRESLRSLLYG